MLQKQLCTRECRSDSLTNVGGKTQPPKGLITGSREARSFIPRQILIAGNRNRRSQEGSTPLPRLSEGSTEREEKSDGTFDLCRFCCPFADADGLHVQLGSAEGPETVQGIPEWEDRVMEELACSGFMQSFYGDMGTWGLAAVLLLIAGIYRELIVLPARRKEQNEH